METTAGKGGEMKIPGLTTKQVTQKIGDDLRAQAFIKEKYGKEKIGEAKERLCSACTLCPCVLLPITTKGEECPYYKGE